MEQEKLKEAAVSAEKEYQERIVSKQVEKIKALVKATLEEIDLLKKEKEEIESKISILKGDLENLKNGRIDLIKQRQDVDELAKKVSVIKIVEVKRNNNPYYPYYPWNRPYYIYNQKDYVDPTITWCSTDIDNDNVVITGKLTQTYSAGAYNVNGHVINFR